MGKLPRRFRVRTLLILVLVVGVPLGLWKRARNEKLAVEATYAALEQENCVIDYEYLDATVLRSLAEFLGIGYANSSWVQLLGIDLEESIANRLNCLPTIHHFDFSGGELCELKYLHARPECERVTIHCDGANEDFSLVAEVFPNVRYLEISQTTLTDDDIATLSRIATLEELDVGGCKALTSRYYAHLKRAPSLRSLTVSNLSPESVAEIAQIKNLETLHIYRSDFVANSLQLLRSLPKLEELRLTNCSIPPGTQFPLFSKVSRIDLSGSRFPGEWIAELSKISNLRTLSLGSCPVELADHHAELLLQLPHLWKLNLSRSTCSESFVVRLLAHPHLKEIWLNNCKINWEDSTVWPEKTSLRTLYLWDVVLPDGKQELLRKRLAGRASFSALEMMFCP